MAFEVFNFGKRLGLVGPGAEAAATPIGGGTSPDKLPPIQGRLQVIKGPCPEGYERVFVGSFTRPDPLSIDNPLDPNTVTYAVYGCQPGLRSSGGRDLGPLQKGPGIKTYEPTYKVRFGPCVPGSGGDEGKCCNEEQKKKIEAMIRDILNDDYIKFTFGGMRSCMIEALEAIEFICVKDGTIDFPPDYYWTDSDWRWETTIRQNGKVWLPESAIEPYFLIRAMLAKCDKGGYGYNPYPSNLEGFVLGREVPPCDVMQKLVNGMRTSGTARISTLLEWDPTTGIIYLRNVDGSRGKQVNRGSEAIWKCKMDRSGKFVCCP